MRGLSAVPQPYTPDINLNDVSKSIVENIIQL